MSKRKFDYAGFIGDAGYFIAFDAEKYGLLEARKIAENELDTKNLEEKIMFVHFGFGVTDDGEKELGYWLNEHPIGHAFSVWAFSRAGSKTKGEGYNAKSGD